MATRRIVPIGGFGLGEPKLIAYLVSLARASRPRACFLGTASGDDASYIKSFYVALAAVDARPTHLELFTRTVQDVAGFLREQDIVYVGGGNTVNTLAIWRAHGVDRALREAYASGTLLTGHSAGCICWFEAGTTDSFGPELSLLRDGLGLLAGSACPHYDSEQRRRPLYTSAVASGFPAGYALDDGVALRFDDERLVEAASARDGARAFRVEQHGERALDVRML